MDEANVGPANASEYATCRKPVPAATMLLAVGVVILVAIAVALRVIGIPRTTPEYFAIRDLQLRCDVQCRRTLSFNGWVKNGDSKVFHGGTLAARGAFKSDLRDGLWIYFDDDGRVSGFAVFVMGDLHGDSLIIPRPGSVGRSQAYARNHLISEGTLAMTSLTTSRDDGYVTDYFIDSTRQVRMRREVTGKIRTMTYFAMDGKMLGTAHFQAGRLSHCRVARADGNFDELRGDAALSWEECFQHW